MFFLFSA